MTLTTKLFIVDWPQARKAEIHCCAPHTCLLMPLVLLLFFLYASRWQPTAMEHPDPWSRKQVCVCSCLHEHVCICAGVCSPPCLSVWWREAAVPEWRGMPAGSDEAAAAAEKAIGHGRHMRTGREKWRWSRQIEPSRGERLMREVPRVERAMAASAC